MAKRSTVVYEGKITIEMIGSYGDSTFETEIDGDRIIRKDGYSFLDEFENKRVRITIETLRDNDDD